MTREELIAYGEDYYKDLICACCNISEIHKEFVKTAIEALKFQTEPSGDLISREMAEKEINRYIAENKDSGDLFLSGCADGAYHALCMIKDLPTIQPKKGEWIQTDEWKETVDGFERWGYFEKCSKCGYVFKELEIDNFCPNCGADMRGEKG